MKNFKFSPFGLDGGKKKTQPKISLCGTGFQLVQVRFEHESDLADQLFLKILSIL